MKYRADIDGLRAVAVAPVVLFHLQVETFAGGFAGVDVFFVISGFLITSLILAEIEAGRFSFVAFFLRRCRRLAPALFTVLAASTLAALVLMMPYELKTFGVTLVATVLSVSNFVFSSQIGYFDAAALTKPLLHTWSLAVEEQFYVVISLVLVAAARYGRVSVVATLAGLALVSFILSVEAVASERTAAYFHLPTRGFELLIGALLATGTVPALRHAGLRGAAALGGLAMIGATVLLFDAATPFPGIAALLPCLGTALVLHAGTGAPTPLHRLLASSPLVALGRISYPVYLWHWPLIVFWTYATLAPPSPVEQVVIAGLTLVLAALTAHYIEAPIRRRQWLASDGALARLVVAGSGAAIAAGVVAVVTQGLPQRLAPDVQRMAATRQERPTIGRRCRAVDAAAGEETPCVLGEATAAGFDFALVGDSHAFATAEAIGERAKRFGLKGVLLARVACPPLLDVERQPEARRQCARHAAQAVERIETLGIRTVILVARWDLYLAPDKEGMESGNRSRLSDGMYPDDRGAVFARGLVRTLNALEGRQVAVLGGLPDIGFPAPSAVARRRHFGLTPPLGPTLEDHALRQAAFEATLAPIIDARDDRLVLIDPAPQLCPNERCLIVDGDAVLYYDGNHLSPAGAARVAPAFDTFFTELYREIVVQDPSRELAHIPAPPGHASRLP